MMGGAPFALPTIFDSLDSRSKACQQADWRARAEHEKQPDERWGYARDLSLGLPALPEILAEISDAGEMQADCIGIPVQDWSQRPFLTRSMP